MTRTGTLSRMLRRLATARSGLAMTEFALAAPLFLSAGMWGLETANLAVTQMEISQLAIHVADNGSRIGDTSVLENRRIYENDINDLLLGAAIQAGGRIALFEHGRVIVSSLEVVPGTDDQQYIHWQRCGGKREHVSSYGEEGDGRSIGLDGMGPAGEKVYAFDDEAVIFVELSYTYQPLISELFTPVREMSATAAFNVRDSRDLSEIYQRDRSRPDPVAKCSAYDNPYTVPG